MALTTYQLEQEIAALNMQIEGHAKAGYEKELRIAELEREGVNLRYELNKALGQLAEVPKWQPIETAPKDKSVMLYAGELVPIYFGRKRYGTLGEPNQDHHAWRCNSSGCYANPTHWAPMPKTPAPNPEQAT